MATRIDQSFGPSAPPDDLLIDRLRGKSPRPKVELRKIGLKRSNALSDVSDSFKSLSNILEKISLTDQAEQTLYGRTYNASDWSITRNFLTDKIDIEFLKPLSGLGGSLSPRSRIEDRIGLVDSFYGRGLFDGLQDGPDAQFYTDKGPKLLGYIRFSFDDISGAVTVVEIKSPDRLSSLSASSILEGSDKVVVEAGETSLLLESPSTWTVITNLLNLSKIKQIVGEDEFINIEFELRRPYSVVYPPSWFTESPSSPTEADSLDTLTSPRLLTNKSGEISPLTQKSYWFSKSYVEQRWFEETEEDLTELIQNYETSVVEDSNMKWLENPNQLRGQQYNWGIRWDGYIKVVRGNFLFTVQTNVSVKIDMDIAEDWVNVFSTDTAALRLPSTDSYVAQSSYNTFSVKDQYKFFTGPGVNDWEAYVPITIRMFRGGPDKADETALVPSIPDLFIKTRSVPSPKNYYGGSYPVSLSGTDGSWTLSSESLPDIISILQDSLSSVSFSVTREGLTTPIALVTNGTTVTSSTTGLSAGNYELSVIPLVIGTTIRPLWKGRIASPGPLHKNYSDMTDGSYTPDVRKISFNDRPDWWKVSDGSPYIRGEDTNSFNTPLDGFLTNLFKPSLQSLAPGLGLYGDGEGNYTQRPNIIVGEARYSESESPGSNYTGILLKANRLGEGGKLIINALPINNSTNSDSLLLGANELGGDPNHETIAAGNLVPRTIRLYLWTNPSSPNPAAFNKYFTFSNLLSVSANDDPTVYGLPPFSDPAWSSPLTISCVRVADNSDFTVNAVGFVAPLTLSAEKLTVGGFNLIAFSTTLSSILTGGVETSQFSGKYIQFYNESDPSFQFSLIDTGEGLCFSDTLKFTYEGGVLIPSLSEVPRPPSARVTPFGYELGGICYPPYTVDDPLLSPIAIDDATLASSSLGNFDVFWGDQSLEDLGGKTLTITEKIEFSGRESIFTLSSPVTVNPNLYTHRFRIDVPIDPSLSGDVLEFIGNGEKVKDSYYAYVAL